LTDGVLGWSGIHHSIEICKVEAQILKPLGCSWPPTEERVIHSRIILKCYSVQT
jgi:hypothetical protein